MIYSGRVQGVGFRMTARHVSENHAVVGFVRNLQDGTVELQAEGELEAVDAFLADVRRQMGGNIVDEQVVSVPATGRETTFGVLV